MKTVYTPFVKKCFLIPFPVFPHETNVLVPDSLLFSFRSVPFSCKQAGETTGFVVQGKRNSCRNNLFELRLPGISVPFGRVGSSKKSRYFESFSKILRRWHLFFYFSLLKNCCYAHSCLLSLVVRFPLPVNLSGDGPACGPGNGLPQ